MKWMVKQHYELIMLSKNTKWYCSALADELTLFTYSIDKHFKQQLQNWQTTYAISWQSAENLPDSWKLETYLPRMAEVSRNIVNDGGKLTQFHGKLRKLTQFLNVWIILTAWRQGIQVISMTTAWDSSDTCSNGRNLHDIYGDGSMHNPKYSINIEVRLTKMTGDSSDYYSDGRTLCDSRRLCIIFLDLTIQVQSSNHAPICDNPFQSY